MCLFPPEFTISWRALPSRLCTSRWTRTVRLCVAALADLQRIHLPQDDFEEQGGGGGAAASAGKHLELAPYVLEAVSSLNRLLTYLMQFPAPPETAAAASDDAFDSEFDSVDAPGGSRPRGKGPKTPPSRSSRPLRRGGRGSCVRQHAARPSGRLWGALAACGGAGRSVAFIGRARR